MKVGRIVVGILGILYGLLTAIYFGVLSFDDRFSVGFWPNIALFVPVLALLILIWTLPLGSRPFADEDVGPNDENEQRDGGSR